MTATFIVILHEFSELSLIWPPFHDAILIKMHVGYACIISSFKYSPIYP